MGLVLIHPVTCNLLLLSWQLFYVLVLLHFWNIHLCTVESHWITDIKCITFCSSLISKSYHLILNMCRSDTHTLKFCYYLSTSTIDLCLFLLLCVIQEQRFLGGNVRNDSRTLTWHKLRTHLKLSPCLSFVLSLFCCVCFRCLVSICLIWWLCSRGEQIMKVHLFGWNLNVSHYYCLGDWPSYSSCLPPISLRLKTAIEVSKVLKKPALISLWH